MVFVCQEIKGLLTYCEMTRRPSDGVMVVVLVFATELYVDVRQQTSILDNTSLCFIYSEIGATPLSDEVPVSDMRLSVCLSSSLCSLHLSSMLQSASVIYVNNQV